MSLFRNVGRKVEQLKQQIEDAADEEAKYECMECGKAIYTEREECPDCGAAVTPKEKEQEQEQEQEQEND